MALAIRAADVAVVGAGIVGLSAAEALSRAGADVVCFERGEPGSGQSAGLTRVFRHVHADPSLVLLARDARAGWRAWEERAGRRLLGGEGVLFAGPEADDRAARLAAAAVPHRFAEGDELAAALPILSPEAGRALLDPGGGAIRVRRAVEALAGWLGERLVRAEVLGLRPDGDSVLVQSSEGLWRVRRAVVCAGAQTPELAAALGLELPVETFAHLRATFEVRPEHLGRPLACWLDRTGTFGEAVYSAPLGSSGRYVLGLAGGGADVPVARPGGVMSAERDLAGALERLRRYVARALPGLDPEPVATRLCLLTTLPWDADAFAAWQAGPVTVFAGHNLFKLAPELGRLLAEAVASDAIPPALAPGPSLRPA